MTIRVGFRQRVVPGVGIKVERPRVGEINIRHRLRRRLPVWARKPPLRPTKISCPEEIEARF